MGCGGPASSGPSPASARDVIGVPFVPSCSRRTRCAAAAGPHGPVPPVRCRSGAACGCPGHPSARELGQKRETAELITRSHRSPDYGDRIFRLERSAAESLSGSAANDPGVLPGERHGPFRAHTTTSSAGAAVPAGVAPPEESETVRAHAREIRDLLRDPGRLHRPAGGGPRRRPDRAATQDTDSTRTTGRRRVHLPLGPPERSEAVLPARQRPVRARLDGAGFQHGVRAVGGDSARRGDGRRAPGPAVAPLPHRQHLRQQQPDAASDGGLEGHRSHGLEGWGRRERPAEGETVKSGRVELAGDRTGEIVLLGKKIRDTVRCNGRSPLPSILEARRGGPCKRPQCGWVAPGLPAHPITPAVPQETPGGSPPRGRPAGVSRRGRPRSGAERRESYERPLRIRLSTIRLAVISIPHTSSTKSTSAPLRVR